MKSSSQLFPVSLLRADSFAGLTEDVYLVKHNRDPDLSVQVAVSHLGRNNQTPGGPPVILLHGSFTNRGFWLSHKGEGLARHLLDQGFDVWMMEMRGHGMSPRNQDYANNTLERYALYDLPAVSEFVAEKTSAAPVWAGHSLGGVTIASAVAAGALAEDVCRGMVLFGTQTIRRPLYQWVPLASLAARTRVRMKGELDGRKMGIGPENEPAGLINEYLARHGLLGSWQFKSSQQKLMPLWKSQRALPLLAFAAAADCSDPARYCERFANLYGGEQKTLFTLGSATGFSRDYGHVDMVVSRQAADEVWPKVSDWLKSLE
ncbi:MAG: alpha/beta hydrolase [Oceanospirillaceae bacterium]|nr:alpha/beta hydrolase [Oceanospirillaceae bacterium]|tara:strand:- start:41533 stop:42486 length:954 start_codon:yes stop_codon:yes gene_type:complete